MLDVLPAGFLCRYHMPEAVGTLKHPGVYHRFFYNLRCLRGIDEIVDRRGIGAQTCELFRV